MHVVVLAIVAAQLIIDRIRPDNVFDTEIFEQVERIHSSDNYLLHINDLFLISGSDMFDTMINILDEVYTIKEEIVGDCSPILDAYQCNIYLHRLFPEVQFMAVVCKHSPTGKYDASWNIEYPTKSPKYIPIIRIIRDYEPFEIRRKIPKIIHKVLIQDDMKLYLNNERCEFTLAVHSSWQKLNPYYEMRYYSGDDCRAFLKKYFKDPNVLNAFDSLEAYSHKCDFFRYCVLYIHGGYYSDWKMILHQPLEQWVSGNKRFVCAWDMDRFVNCHGNMFNAFIGSVPKSPILYTAIKMIINNVKTKYYGNTPLDPTGPGLLGKAFATHYSY